MQENAQTVHYDSKYIISFIAWDNEPITDNQKRIFTTNTVHIRCI